MVVMKVCYERYAWKNVIRSFEKVATKVTGNEKLVVTIWCVSRRSLRFVA